MEYKETQNSILFKNEYEEEFLKLTKEFGVDAVMNFLYISSHVLKIRIK